MEPPKVTSIPIPKIRVEEWTLGWNVAMKRGPKVVLQTLPFVPRAPQVLSLRMAAPEIHVDSFYFGNPEELCKPNERKVSEKTEKKAPTVLPLTPEDEIPPWDDTAPGSAIDSEEAASAQRGDEDYSRVDDEKSLMPDGVSPEDLDLPENANETEVEDNTEDTSESLQNSIPESVTHLLPPKNLIKLEDRLRYLLQPPLEQLYSDKNLVFPFVPFPYQWEGVSFLYSRDVAILADEMGLGKTMQAITTVRLLLRNGDIRSVLFVCPKPLVTNWKREFEVWAPEIPVLVIEGDQVRRQWQWGLQDMPVKIANYELLNRDREYFSPKKGIPKHFDLVVLDESQRIKNQRSATAVAARSISRTRNWAMTGTPIENSSEDLVGIFEFLSPGFLTNDMKPAALGRTVSDYILRRTKDLVLKDMPPRLYRDAGMYMTPEQQQTYTMAETRGALRLSEMGEAATIQHVFELVLRLKQICNFDPCSGDSPKLQRLDADLEEVAASGRKAIVFSQWTDTIFRLRTALKRFGPLEYHGKIPHAKRDGVIEKFRNSPDKHVLLMSYGAGSVGLNLQFCNYVFLFDRWWNPAIEDQAINRAHRIGVKGAVTVTRFLMLNTIEERIDRILQEKRDLFDTILSGSKEKQKLGLTQDEVFGLFKLKSPKGTIEIPNL